MSDTSRLCLGKRWSCRSSRYADWLSIASNIGPKTSYFGDTFGLILGYYRLSNSFARCVSIFSFHLFFSPISKDGLCSTSYTIHLTLPAERALSTSCPKLQAWDFFYLRRLRSEKCFRYSFGVTPTHFLNIFEKCALSVKFSRSSISWIVSDVSTKRLWASPIRLCIMYCTGDKPVSFLKTCDKCEVLMKNFSLIWLRRCFHKRLSKVWQWESIIIALAEQVSIS